VAAHPPQRDINSVLCDSDTSFCGAIQTRLFSAYSQPKFEMTPYNTRPSNKMSRPGLVALSPRKKAKLIAAQGQSSKLSSQAEQDSSMSKIKKLQQDVLTESEIARERESLPLLPAADKIQRGPKTQKKSKYFPVFSA
jgi:hypothetical protein